ncbi:hypothetical protein GN958_ATG11088 [Phytophthora infestans]|uniref:BED-type domain-containing protein n=1 Tax=Phytophthora infestans TaxID=4787 RepID=A0A8S9UGD6_PHYIN|nr:hypothetical protein GN958_ATG11088 [Phytophthora infestans]
MRESANPKAKCWEKFRFVYEKATGIAFTAHETGFVVCLGCHAIYAFHRKNGTSTLNSHSSICTTKNPDSGSDSIVKFASKQDVSSADKKWW